MRSENQKHHSVNDDRTFCKYQRLEINKVFVWSPIHVSFKREELNS